MKEDRQEKLKISNDLLDAMLVGVKTQDDLWGKDGIITQLNKALLERILNAEMDFHLENTNEGRSSGNTRNGYGKKTLKSNLGCIELSTPPRYRHHDSMLEEYREHSPDYSRHQLSVGIPPQLF